LRVTLLRESSEIKLYIAVIVLCFSININNFFLRLVDHVIRNLSINNPMSIVTYIGSCYLKIVFTISYLLLLTLEGRSVLHSRLPFLSPDCFSERM